MKMKRGITYGILFLDLISMIAALGLASYLHPSQTWGMLLSRSMALQWLPALAAAWGIWILLYFRMELDGFRGGWHFPTMSSQLSLGVGLWGLLLMVFAFAGHFFYSRLAGFVLNRCAMALLLRSSSRRGATRRIAILGNGHVAREFARKIERHPELMCEVVGFLFPGDGDRPGPTSGAPADEAVSVPTMGVLDVLRSRNVDELLIALPDASAAELKKLVALCREGGISISVVPQWYELYVSRARFVDLDGLPMLSLLEGRTSSVTAVFKRAMDLVLGAAFSVVALPLLVPAAFALLVSKRRAFASETRCGLDGRPFKLYRLNVDRNRLELLNPFERVLAQLSLTELPQLFNVLGGSMSLVGPRPESPQRVRHYSDWQRQRLSAKPGLTGLAQVHGLRDQHSSEEKARFDLQYIYHRSIFLDLSLVLQTCWTLAIRIFSPAHLAAPPPSTTPAEVPVTKIPAEVGYADSTHSCAD